ncbi:MAG: hypothetical protein ACTHU0_12290 [Kofleriaceae bacterium]
MRRYLVLASFMLVNAIRAMGWSNRDAGREVLAAWKRHERLGKYPKPEAIAVKIGLLANGNATWWLNHEKALEALAELLHCRPDDLLPRDAERRPAQIHFAEFGEIAGLLPGQEPCAVNPDGWLGTYVRASLRRGGRWWFAVPPGGGKSLAVRVLKERADTNAVVTTARTLFDAARQAKDAEALVVEVDHEDPASDIATMKELSQRVAPTCILAAFERPGSASNDGWNARTFALHSNWREQLVGWLRSRVPSPDRLDTNAILTWLETVDPIGSVFTTPGDLVSIVAHIYRTGIPERSVGLGELANEWLSQAVGGDGDAWLRRFGREAVERLGGERVRRLDLALEPLSTSTWAGLLPEDLLRPSSEPSPAKRGNKAKRDVGSEPAAVFTNAREAVHALADRGVLRATLGGGLDMFPNWVRAGIERDAIQHQVRSSNAAGWGLWANDASRKGAVDDALDAMGPNELVRAASKIHSGDDLASIAASEALFSAFGRRFTVSAWRPIGEAIAILQDLGLRQLRLLDRNERFGAPSRSLPLTRHRPNANSRWETDWWKEAWAFSFAVPKPDSVQPDPGWRLPAWARGLGLRDAPHLSHVLGYSRDPLRDDDPWILGVLRTARAAVRACQDAELPDDVDLCLLTWVVIDGPSRGWRIGKSLASSLVGTRVLDYVYELIRREPEDVCIAAVSEAWRALLQVDAYANPLYALRMLRDAHRTFFDLLTTHLPLDVFTAAFTGVDLLHTGDVFTRLLPEIPDRLSRPLIRIIAAQAGATNVPIWNLDADVVKAFGHDQFDVLVDLTAERFLIGGVAAKRAWTLDHQRSLDESLNALRAGIESASTWFYAAPLEHLPPMLHAIRELGVRPAWVQRWLATVLSRAGTHAPLVFEMMTTDRLS